MSLRRGRTGGAATHTIATPVVDATYTAVFRPVSNPRDGAAYESQYFLSFMAAGQTYEVNVTFLNDGTTAWSPEGNCFLGSVGPEDNTVWGLNRVSLGGVVLPGETAAFRFNVTAPRTGGVYNMQWRMLREGTGYFGAASEAVPVVVGVVPAAAAFVSQSVPAVMNAGQSYSVSIAMRNVGTNVWTEAERYRLGSQIPRDNVNWGVNRGLLAAVVAPGEVATFTFNVTAPESPGVYHFQWRMMQEGFKGAGVFGDLTPDLPVEVRTSGNAAAFLSQTVPATMQPGQRYPVTVQMRNTGTTTWTVEGKHRLAAVNPQDNQVWGQARVLLAGPVAPGGVATFAFNATAPTQPGAYNFQWRMVQDGVSYFGASSENVSVQVGTGLDDAAFVSQSTPTTVKKGSSFFATIRMKNTGTATWLASGVYKLGSQNPLDNSTWGLNRALLGVQTAPDGTASFTFLARAPATAGTYNFQWQMVQEGVGFFDERSANVAVVVTE